MAIVFAGLIQACLAISRRFLPEFNNPHLIAAVEITAIAVAECLTLLIVVWLMRRGNASLSELGVWKRAPAMSWALGIGLGVLTAWWGRSNPALHLASRLGALFDTSLWHLYSAILAGTAAGFCEEIIFRGFVMRELAAAGHARWVQVAGSAVVFGVAHAGLLRAGMLTAFLVIIPTAMLGAVYALIYLNARRSLTPVILSHFLNDVAVIPWVFLSIANRIRH